MKENRVMIQNYKSVLFKKNVGAQTIHLKSPKHYQPLDN